ncbi:hypothetical protein DH09_16520 [Bacillaceae bacterium JMAK1]|nr:hypothetical protein DH09_16520 [Bacillaceae bacterium JMAK1]
MKMHTKIFGLMVGLITVVALSMAAFLAYIEYHNIYESLGDQALSSAVHIANSPEVVDAFTDDNPSELLQQYADHYQRDMEAEFIVIGNDEGERYAHPDEWKIGEAMVGGDNDLALIAGRSYVSVAEGTRGMSLRGKTPIHSSDGEIIGVVSVGFLVQDIHAEMWQRIGVIVLITSVIVVIGALGSMLLSRSIRKDMYGLEPKEIGALYHEREATFAAIREGVIAVDSSGVITSLNSSARKILNVSGDIVGKNVQEIIVETKIPRVLRTKKAEYNDELFINGQTIIVNRQPILDGNDIQGVVSSFRDKTEMIEMANTLSDIKSYSEDLRAQNHEFTNKLYTLSGYMHLGLFKEAKSFIAHETSMKDKQNHLVTNYIKDTTIQAILVGKYGRASELKVDFSIDPESRLERLPAHIGDSQIISIIGNVINNALEASLSDNQPAVTVSISDYGKDLIVEVTDNGQGLSADLDHVIEKGYSTKGSKRGYGLAIVQALVEDYEGFLEYHRFQGETTVFTVYLPKQLRGGQSNDSSAHL